MAGRDCCEGICAVDGACHAATGRTLRAAAGLRGGGAAGRARASTAAGPVRARSARDGARHGGVASGGEAPTASEGARGGAVASQPGVCSMASTTPPSTPAVTLITERVRTGVTQPVAHAHTRPSPSRRPERRWPAHTDGHAHVLPPACPPATPHLRPPSATPLWPAHRPLGVPTRRGSLGGGGGAPRGSARRRPCGCARRARLCTGRWRVAWRRGGRRRHGEAG